jgi:hypothetical protein
MQIFLSIDYSGPNHFRDFYNELPVLMAQRERYACDLLDITPATLRRYCGDFGNPPKAMVRLLYLECHKGRRHANIDLFNDYQFANQRVHTLLQEVERLTSKIKALNADYDALRRQKNSDDSAANSPFYRVA